MQEIVTAIVNYWCAGIIGFFVGGLAMFILSCLHHARYYEEMIKLKAELKAYEKVCEEE